MTPLVLLAAAGALMLGGAQLRHLPLARRHPKLGILAWQVLSATALSSLALAGLALLVPTSSLGTDLAGLVRACITTLQAAYAAPAQVPAVTAGALLLAAATLWPAVCTVAQLVVAARDRRRTADALALVASHDPALGATVVDADVVAAYCLPGRRSQVVLTTAAVRSLGADELAAVVAHERAHLHGRHHLAVAVAQGLACAFPRVPLFDVAAREVPRLVELLADDAAARRTDELAVAGALVALAGMRAPRAALPAADAAGAARVARLLDPAAPMRAGHRAAVVVALTLVALAPLTVATYPAVAASGADVCTLVSAPV